MTVYEHTGRFFEDLEIGDVFRHSPARTVTEADNLLFSALSMNRHSLHFDEEWAQQAGLGGRSVNAFFTLAVVVGTGVAEMTEGTAVGLLGLEAVSFPAPVRIGDTVRSETEVVSKRVSASKPGLGIVVFEHRGANQHGSPVCVARRASLVRLRIRPE
jgi:acyl dehydratase